MAAGDFLASVVPNTLIKLEELTATPHRNKDLTHPTPTMEAFMQMQTGQIEERLNSQNICDSVEVAFLKNGGGVVANFFDTPIAEACDIGGVESESDKVAYSPNIGLYVDFKVSDAECQSNVFAMADRLARESILKTTQLKQALNELYISTIDSNASANLFTGTRGTILGVDTQFAANEFDSTLLAEIALTAEHNKMYNIALLTGNAFFHEKFMHQYKEDHARTSRIFTEGPFPIIDDVVNVDSIVGATAVYAVNPSSLIFWNTAQYQNDQPVLTFPDKAIYTYSMPMPDTFYMHNGELREVRIDVMAKKECVNDGSGGWAKEAWSFRYRLTGGLHVAPPADDNSTGILKFVAV